MCGIVGIYSLNQRIEENFLSVVTESLAHRGPDGQGIWLSENKKIGLGHRRLNIVDAMNGHQPMMTEDNLLSIVVNGEFYDDLLIRENLQKEGYSFKTHSDSELLLSLYKKYDLDFVHHLRGEFSFILFDSKKQTMIAVRDRFGIKPLYYHLSDQKTLTIASEAKAIFKAGIKAQWNHYSMFHVSCFQYRPQDQTLFKDIYQVPPGHMLIFDGEKLTVSCYWDLNFPLDVDSNVDENETIEILKNKIENAISCRLRSDNIPLCCHLSGGLDSATIAALASKLYGKAIPCFSVKFEHEWYDEISIANSLAKHIGADFYPVIVDANAIVDNISDAVFYSEGLSINNHLAAKYILNKQIRKSGFKIALTGEGSDEIFAGYPHFKQDLQSGSPDDIFHTNVISDGIQISNDKTLSVDVFNECLGFIPSFIRAKLAIGFQMHEILSDDFKKSYSIENIYRSIIPINMIKKELLGRNKVNQSAYLWIKFALTGYILNTLGDGCEMAHGIEGRVPFLDHHLFEYVRQIPLKLKIYNGIEKYILRETVKNDITSEIYHRQKHPFMAPPLSILNNKKGIEMINDHLRSQAFKNMPFYNQEKVVILLDDMGSKSINTQIKLEPILMILLTSCLLGLRYNL